jgi:hypothetical protein
MIINLLETSHLPELSPSSDYIRRISSEFRCPHPWLVDLASQRYGARGRRCTPISRLFGMCTVQDTSSRRAQPPSASAKSEKKASEAVASDGLFTCVIPLSRTCHEELMRTYFGEDQPEIAGGDRPVSYHNNACYIIPDHSRTFYNPRRKPTGLTRGAGTSGVAPPVHPSSSIPCPSCDRDGLFEHTYALLPVPMPLSDQEEPRAASSGGALVGGKEEPYAAKRGKSTARPPSGSSSARPSVSSKAADNVRYYLVQIKRPSLLDDIVGDPRRDEPAAIKEKYQGWDRDDELVRKMMNEHDVDRLLSFALPGEASDAEKKKWDPKLLSSLCRWRSCLAEAEESAHSKHYCAYHADIKRYLDLCSACGATGNMFDSTKYLPKRPIAVPQSAVDRDLRLIRCASALLQEVWEGKLKATVQSYVRKMCQDMSLRQRLALNSESYTQKVQHAPACFSDSGLPFGVLEDHGVSPKLKKGLSAFGRNPANYLPQGRVPSAPSWAKWRDTDNLKE